MGTLPLEPWHRPSPLHWDTWGLIREDTPQLVTQLLEDEAAHEWAEAHEALRSELSAAVARFRAECAPLVGPEVTVHGLTLVPARRVPVDPAAYQARIMRGGFDQVRSQVANVWGTPTATMSQAMDQIRQAWGPTQAAFALVDGEPFGEEEEDNA